jgi:hypothetical protein
MSALKNLNTEMPDYAKLRDALPEVKTYVPKEHAGEEKSGDGH